MEKLVYSAPFTKAEELIRGPVPWKHDATPTTQQVVGSASKPDQKTTVTAVEAAATADADKPASKGLILPNVYHGIQNGRSALLYIDVHSPASIQDFFADEVDVTRLNNLSKHLWVAGLPRPARPLHHQHTLGREFILTERADMHLLWLDKLVYLKPLPDFLLCADSWTDVICEDPQLYKSALGFLQSYIWLITRESDIRLAHQHGLISQSITWERWNDFVGVVIRFVNARSGQVAVNPRYLRGELRLGRVNLITRFAPHPDWSITKLLRGYQDGYQHYTSFMNFYLAWLASATIYVALVLTAMQVGLATDKLNHNDAFQRAAYGFTVFSILAPLIVIALLSLVVLFAVIFNWQYSSRKEAKKKEISLWPRRH